MKAIFWGIVAGFFVANVAWAEIRIGVPGPTTGGNAAYGMQILEGVNQAAKDFNKTGGIFGQTIRIEQDDDASNPKQGLAVADSFIQKGVKFVVGHLNFNVTMPASELYTDHDILMMTPSVDHPDITDRKFWNVFRTCSRNDHQAKLWADLVLTKLNRKNIAILHDKTPYGQGLADIARNAMNAGGKKEVWYEGVDVGKKDYSETVSKLKEVGADYVIWGGFHTEGGLILRQMRLQGLKTIMISGDGIATEDFAQIGGPGVEGTLMSFPPDVTKNPAAQDVVAKFRERGFDPQGYTLYAYAAVQIIKNAAETTLSLEPKKIAAYLHQGKEIHTILGDIAYDDKGDRLNPDFVWYVWTKGVDGKLTFVQQ